MENLETQTKRDKYIKRKSIESITCFFTGLASIIGGATYGTASLINHNYEGYWDI